MSGFRYTKYRVERNRVGTYHVILEERGKQSGRILLTFASKAQAEDYVKKRKRGPVGFYD